MQSGISFTNRVDMNWVSASHRDCLVGDHRRSLKIADARLVAPLTLPVTMKYFTRLTGWDQGFQGLEPQPDLAIVTPVCH